MLYDPKWETTTTKPDVLSLDGLIAWLEQQPAADQYCYSDNGHCLLARYFVASGFGPRLSVGLSAFAERKGDKWGRDHRYASSWDDLACTRPWTFGAALDRARALRDR